MSNAPKLSDPTLYQALFWELRTQLLSWRRETKTREMYAVRCC